MIVAVSFALARCRATPHRDQGARPWGSSLPSPPQAPAPLPRAAPARHLIVDPLTCRIRKQDPKGTGPVPQGTVLAPLAPVPAPIRYAAGTTLVPLFGTGQLVTNCI